MKDNDFLSLIKDFSVLEQVDAIALAGSHTTKWSNLRSSEILYDEEADWPSCRVSMALNIARI